MKKIRLSKIMSERALCSRREADNYIYKGWVSVDGVKVDQLGYQCSSDVDIQLDTKADTAQNKKMTILLNKPLGYISGPRQDTYKAAKELLILNNKDPKCPVPVNQFNENNNLVIAGRLDINSSGLMAFTEDGRVAKQLIEDHSQVEKEYRVMFDGYLSQEKLSLLQCGLRLDGVPLRRAQVTLTKNKMLKMILRQGRKRQIRRMFELIDLDIISLKRVRIGNINLRALPKGKWRYLQESESFI